MYVDGMVLNVLGKLIVVHVFIMSFFHCLLHDQHFNSFTWLNRLITLF